ncbi:cytochrome P450 [Bradyrhizobium sp. LHD-71]|uniref:cytochrome P450 n=1 Tax=Bradyrhizobium sp. LHD-71 TaxID=3072141 RepID=UPI0028107E06|nr:cytochrome P450 [Bradyrhizobium sp. LHD-71]MDQ8726232.1 cytochrome P450 [Bradyrhizobium sp. LHD-71]
MNVAANIDHETLARTLPLDQFDPGNPKLFQDDVWMPYFARLRQEDPVHYCKESRFGPYWSVTKYKDIMTVETSHTTYSSESALGGISIVDRPVEFRRPSFISMDPPKHDEHRKVVQPIVAPGNLAKLEQIIRERTCSVLDSLPRNETFNWVDLVSIELTTRMLATLFDFPFEDRRKLTYWSDVATADVNAGGPINSEEKRTEVLQECLQYFTRLWEERANAAPGSDLVSMLAHGPATRNLSPKEFLGTLTLLIVGGNDTTRNSMSAGLWFLHQNPAEFAKLRENPALVDTMVPEIIRYHTPLSHMRRTAVQDAELNGKTIRKGDKVVMWYISGNRDADAIENPDTFIIDRKRPRQHLSFGFGLHRCVGNRLAELQLRILWEEILKRFERIEVMGPPQRIYSAFVHGISELPVRIPG